MTDLLAARSQMAMSLGFHIIFAIMGIGMPLLMVIAESFYLKTKDPVYLNLAKRWSVGAAVLFAIGAISGTALSFELGLLWPKFMEFAGPIIGMPFSLEGFAFFFEAIFLGIYIYGWEKVSPKLHLFAGVVVTLSGALASILVVTANAWMNTPAGFILKNGQVTEFDPFQAMLNPAAFSETLHMTLAAYVTVGFAAAGVHALGLLKKPDSVFHQRGIRIAFWVGAVAIPLQLLSGDVSARHVAQYQPVKLAAMEGLWNSQKGAPLRIFGWPDQQLEETRYAIEIPYLLSLLAYHNPNAEVVGLKSFPKEDLPPVWPVHVSFQLMVFSGIALFVVAFLGIFLMWRKKRPFEKKNYLRILVIASPLGFVAVETGWMVTEIGRQPWIIYNLMRTKDAVTPMPGLQIPFLIFTALYLVLGILVVYIMKKRVFNVDA